MIRVNLIRNRAQDGTTAGQTSFGSTMNMGSFGASTAARDGLVKVLLVALFAVGLVLYETQNIRTLNDEVARENAQATQLQTQLTAKEAELGGYKGVEVQAKELEDKLNFLKLLSHLRLREVKTLDFVQSSIPEKVWVSDISYAADPKNIEAGHFQFSGHALNTEDLTEFVKRLDESAYLMDVIVVKNQENTTSKAGPVREFQFSAEVENKN